MEKEFIPYEQALALKELGFEEECFGEYFQIGHNFGQLVTSNEDIDIMLNIIYECNAPLYQQAFRWFREKYDFYSIVFYHTDDKVVFQNPHYFRIYEMKYKGEQIEHSKEFKSYEEAELECLKKLIEIIKNK